MDDKKLYRPFKQGRGDAFGLPYNADVRAAAVSGCRTSVGLYVFLGQDRCFVAHIAAELIPNGHNSQFEPERKQGSLLRELVASKLRSCTELNDLMKQLEGRKFDHTRRDFAVCSPHTEEGSAGEASSAKYIIDGLHDFFGEFEVTDAHGFVATPCENKIQYLKWKSDRAGLRDTTYREIVNNDAAYGLAESDLIEMPPSDYGWHSQGDYDHWMVDEDTRTMVIDTKKNTEWHFVFRGGISYANYGSWKPIYGGS